MNPSNADADLASYGASGLPPGLSINSTTGAISGTPDSANTNTQIATVTITDTAGNTRIASVTFSAVTKGDQALSGFGYSRSQITAGDSAPTVRAPTSAKTTLEYSAMPGSVCSVNAGTGALTILGTGTCTITAKAPSNSNYNEATDTFTLVVSPIGALVVNLDAVAGDNTVNIAERAAGFAISGDTGSVGSVSVSVQVGSAALATTSSSADPARWSVDVPGSADYVTESSLSVTVAASRTGYTPPSDVTRSLAVDLTEPTSRSYTAPTSLKVDADITAMNPSTTTDTDIDGYRATGLPSGLSIDSGTGAISGTPDTASTASQAATVTITDRADNTRTVSITFPAVDKGDQTLSGFSYSASQITEGDTAPTVMAPTGAQTTIEYSAEPSSVCTVDSGNGALTIVGTGICTITAKAPSNSDYNEATAAFELRVIAIAPSNLTANGSFESGSTGWLVLGGRLDCEFRSVGRLFRPARRRTQRGRTNGDGVAAQHALHLDRVRKGLGFERVGYRRETARRERRRHALHEQQLYDPIAHLYDRFCQHKRDHLCVQGRRHRGGLRRQRSPGLRGRVRNTP